MPVLFLGTAAMPIHGAGGAEPLSVATIRSDIVSEDRATRGDVPDVLTRAGVELLRLRLGASQRRPGGIEHDDPPPRAFKTSLE